MVKLIQLQGQENKTGGIRLIDLSSAYSTINRNIEERKKQEAIDRAREDAVRMKQLSDEANSAWGLTKATASNAWGMVKQIGKDIVGTTAGVASDLLLPPNLRKDKINMFGQEYQTPSGRASEAGRLASQGKYEEAIGQLGTAALDVASTVFIPGKGLQILKGGRFLEGAIEGATTGAKYGVGYGVTGSMAEGKDIKDVAKEAGKGLIFGASGGLVVGGLTGKLFDKTLSKKAEIKEDPKVFVDLLGQKKNLVDYMATRDNLNIVELKNIGKDLDGNKIQSRLEWDYKNNKGTLLVTPKTNNDVFAHEVGHYIDKTNPEFIDKHKKEIIALTGGNQNLNEDFAFAVKRIITEEDARNVAPGLTKDIENLGIELNAKEKITEQETVNNKSEPLKAVGKENTQISQVAERSSESQVQNKKETKKVKVPTSVSVSAKETYAKELNKGVDKKTAELIARKKVKNYEKFVEKKSKEVPIIEQIRNSRRMQGTTPKRKVKTEGINWKSINTSEDTKNIIDNIFKENEQFKKSRPSRTNKDIIEGARAVGIDVSNDKELDAVLKRMPNANTAVRLKQALVDSANDLMNFLKTVDTGSLSKKESQILQNKFLRTQSIAKAFSGLRTESSHLLRSMGIEVKEGENFAEVAKTLKSVMGETGDNPFKFLEKTQEALKPTKMDTYLAVWYNAILSGWKTWARNIIDNTGVLLTETISKFSNPTTMKEGAEFVAGLLKALPNSLKLSFDVLRGKKEGVSKLSYKKNYEPYFKNKTVNLITTEIAGRVLEAQDMLFSNMLKEAQATVKTFDKQMEKVGIDLPTRVALNDAVTTQFSERNTYRNKPMGNIGKVSTSISQLTDKIPALKFIIPFTNVVSNVIDRKVDYLPFVNLSRTFGKKYLREEADIILKKSGLDATKFEKVRPVIEKRLKQQQLGRVYLGTAVTVASYGLMMNGKLSGGGPGNSNEKKQLMQTGWRPYSIKIGDSWIPYNYLGPLSGIFGAVGSIGDSMKYGKSSDGVIDNVSNGIIGFANFNLSQSFLSGVSDLILVLTGRLDAGKYVTQLATGSIPVSAMYSQTMSLFDRRSVDTQTLKDAVLYRLGLTKYLPPKLTAFGDEVRSDLIYGLTISKERNSYEKGLQDRDLVLNVPDKSTKLGEETMTREQLFEYTLKRGELVKKNYERILQSVDRKQTDDEKKNEFRRWIDNIGEEVKSDLKREYNIQDNTKNKSWIKEKPIVIIK